MGILSWRNSVPDFYYSAIGLLLYSMTFRLPYLGIRGALRLLTGRRRFDKIWDSLFVNKLQSVTMLPDRSRLLSSWGQFYQTNFMVEEIYHKQVYDFFFSPERNYIILDVGASIGVYALRAAKKVGNAGLVIAVEPESENFRFLVKNIQFNKRGNIVPVKLALSSFHGRAKLFLSAYCGKHSLLVKGSSSIEVPVTTTTKLLKELKIRRVDLMKIDVEGAELEVLKGSHELLRSGAISRIVAAAYHSPEQANSLKHYLQTYSYEVKPHMAIIEGRQHAFISARHTRLTLQDAKPR